MKNTRDLTLNALFIALILVLSLVPNIGIIQIGPVAIQAIHIPVIIAGLTLGFKSGILMGFVFGASTLIVALTRASSPFDLLFINPILSVLPRILFGVSIGAMSGLMSNVVKADGIRFGVVAFVSSILHSVFVFIALYFIIFLGSTPLIPGQENPGVLFQILLSIFTFNSLIEAAAAAVIVPPIVIVLKKLMGHRY